ncbi:hypothetical protein [Thalassotalea euphylliae]|uniref:hypothetical protein n=1 Tax=Thalassotalea euphylliae TaxID=1655234 RepID=UPI0011C0519C|nr:hypothetical protein [Thalassotalea euphylliae]
MTLVVYPYHSPKHLVSVALWRRLFLCRLLAVALFIELVVLPYVAIVFYVHSVQLFSAGLFWLSKVLAPVKLNQEMSCTLFKQHFTG